jgi:hypothetical protein
MEIPAAVCTLFHMFVHAGPVHLCLEGMSLVVDSGVTGGWHILVVLEDGELDESDVRHIKLVATVVNDEN